MDRDDEGLFSVKLRCLCCECLFFRKDCIFPLEWKHVKTRNAESDTYIILLLWLLFDALFVSVSVPLHTGMQYIADGKRCLFKGEQLVNAGRIIERSPEASSTTSTSVHVRSYVLQLLALSKDSYTVDLNLMNGAMNDKLLCTRPAQ